MIRTERLKKLEQFSEKSKKEYINYVFMVFNRKRDFVQDSIIQTLLQYNKRINQSNFKLDYEFLGNGEINVIYSERGLQGKKVGHLKLSIANDDQGSLIFNFQPVRHIHKIFNSPKI